ncbi:hypothetical protein Tco_1406224 [Tanacetum coccineum]
MVAFLNKSEGSEDFHQIINFLNISRIKYALIENPTIYTSLIQQFWETAFASTSENEEMEITATIDGRVKTITEASIRRHLKLEDSDGIPTLPHAKKFKQLALMRVQSLGSDEGSLTLNESTVLCTTLSKKVEDLQNDLKQTKLTYGAAYTKLILRVKKLEHKGEKEISTAEVLVSTDSAILKVSTAIPERHKKTKKQLEQERLGHEEAIKLQEQINEEERQMIARDAEIAKWLQEEIDIPRQEQEKYDLAQALELQKELDKRKEVMKRSGFDFQKPPAKRQKIGEVSGSVEEQYIGKEKEVSEEELKKLLVIVPIEKVYIEALQVYQVFEDMLKRFDRDDLEKLWDLVKKKFSSTEPIIDKEKVLWVELKRLFEPDDDDTLWKLQRYMHDPLKWKLYDTCGVHHVSTERGHDIFMLVEKDYPLTRALMTVMLANKLQVDESSEMANELLRKIFYQVNHKFRGGLLGIKIITTSTNWYGYSSVVEGDLNKFSDIGAWYAIKDCAQYDKQCSNPTSVIYDETISNPNAQIVGDDMVRVQVPRCMAWLDYDEHVDSLSTMGNEVGVTSPKSTTQTLPSFEEYTSPVTYPEEVEKTLGISIEVEPLNETKL